MNHPPIFLQPGQAVIIDGVELTYEEIMESKIDSILYRKHLQDRGVSK